MNEEWLSVISNGGLWPLALVTRVSKSWLPPGSSLFRIPVLLLEDCPYQTHSRGLLDHTIRSHRVARDYVLGEWDEVGDTGLRVTESMSRRLNIQGNYSY